MNGRDFVALGMELGMLDDDSERCLDELLKLKDTMERVGQRLGTGGALEQEVTLTVDEVQATALFLIIMQRYAQTTVEIMEDDTAKIEQAKSAITDTIAYLDRIGPPRPSARRPQQYNAPEPGPLRKMFGDDGKFRG